MLAIALRFSIYVHLLSTFCFLLFSNSLQAIDVPSYLSSEHLISGTSSRVEREYKLAFYIDESIPYEKIMETIKFNIQGKIERDEFNFDKLIGEKYQLIGSKGDFVFKDIYFDTPDSLIYSMNSGYRLRYRWRHAFLYFRNNIFSSFGFNHPSRCEIQFKENYSKNVEDRIISVNETRFEFRNASEPFIENQDAPKAPWEESEYIGYASSGVFRDYRMIPTATLISKVNEKFPDRKSVDLQPVFTLETIRSRMHLIVKNPWGSGPNPDHAFIITLDRSRVKDVHIKNDQYSKGEEKTLLEIEIEMDRNTTTELDSLATSKLSKSMPNYPLFKEVKKFSSKGKAAINEDLKKISSSLTQSLTKLINASPLKLENKYARIYKKLNIKDQ